VSSQLSGDRQNLATAISTLGTALGDVTTLVRENRSTLVADVKGLTDVTDTLLKQKNALSEVLDLAPTALQNLDGAYDPEAQALRTKSDMQIGTNPTLFVCQILESLVPGANLCKGGQILPGTPVTDLLNGIGKGTLPGGSGSPLTPKAN
jgi:phospholipid/cholesterol/gamma-HCH transport system substrate-binding protein